MKTIRTFIAIPLDDEVRRAAIKMIGKLRAPEDGIKWVPTDNLHLTLKFLGEVENMEVPGVCKILRDVCRDHEPFHLVFGGASGLPDIARSRVVCASVEDSSQSLTRIVTQLEQDYAEIGFKQEPRDYVPHLTLGRAKGRRANAEVVERVQQHAESELGTMTVDTVCVFGSFLEKGGPVYQIMNTIDL
ncbi:MAG: RNA 2',3'-cyclic phosphodiesterase [Rubripirellula sp.]